MYCHIHHCHYHHCNCVPIDSKETGRALTQEELLSYTQDMKQELKEYTVDLKDQIFSYIDIGVNPVEIANTFNSLKEQDTYILRTLTNKIDELNNTSNLSMFKLRNRVTDLEGQSASIIKDLYEKTLVVESVADLSTINNPKDGLRVYVKSYHAGLNKGGGDFVYDSTRVTENDSGVVINGWVRVAYSNNLPVKLSWFGAKPDSEPSANSNELILFDALKYIDVIVDGYYYITTDVGAVISNSISLSGEGNNSGFAITSASGGMWIKIATADYLTLDNITIYCDLNDSALTLFSPNAVEDLLGELKVTNCRYYGRQRLFRGAWSSVLDANEFKFGIDRIVFANNYIEGTGLFLFLINSCTTYAEIIDNEVKNISRVLFNFSIDKDDNKTSIKENLKHLFVSGNTVINDDDFFATGITGYLCFVLYTGQNCTYKNNWVEGLKTREIASTYDAYLSATNVVYDSNTNKNNICMHPDKTLNYLIKAKGSTHSTHINSSFIVEREFLERHNALDNSTCWVSLVQKDVGSDDAILRILNNTFDVYWMFHEVTSSDIKTVEIIGNSFNCYNMTGTVLIRDMYPVGITTYEDAYISIKNNIFNLENTGMDTGFRVTPVQGFGLLSFKENEGDTLGYHRLLELENNTINIGTVHGTFGIGLAKVQNTSIKDNSIIVESIAEEGKFRPFWASPMGFITNHYSNNIIKLLNESRLFSDGLDTKINTSGSGIYNTTVVGLWSTGHTYFNKPDSGSAKVTIHRKITSEVGVVEWLSQLDFTPEGITYINSEELATTVPYPESGTVSLKPIKKASAMSDTVVDYNPFTLYPLDNYQGHLRMYYDLTGYSGKKCLHEISIKVIPYA